MSNGEQGKQSSWLTRFALGCATVAVVVLVFLSLGEENTFPPLTEGIFVGRISGITKSRDDYRTLYIERVPGSHSLLVVVFDDDWRPQIVPMKRDFEKFKDASLLTEQIPLKPIELASPHGKYLLSGVMHRDSFSGDVEALGGQKRGVWNLSPASPSELSLGSIGYALRSDQLEELLRRKSENIKLRREVKRAEEQYVEEQEKFARLNEFVAQEDELKARAMERREALQTELKQAEVTRKESSKRVDELIGELNLLGRITKRGKAVSLARKVTKRENKWYFANWRVLEDTTGVEELLLANSDISAKELEREYQRAAEKQALQRQIAKEKQQIKKLTAQINGEVSQPGTPGSGGATAPGQKRSLWERLWGKR